MPVEGSHAHRYVIVAEFHEDGTARTEVAARNGSALTHADHIANGTGAHPPAIGDCMQIENSFTVSMPPDEALETLTDVPRIAPCLPGVTLTETHEDGSYSGTASVRLGPVSLSFAGRARIEEIDREARTARVTAEGADQKGRGRASAKVSFAMAPHQDGTEVTVRSDINLTGAVAQYGRASGLIKEVANQIISEFVHNLETELPAGRSAEQKDGDGPSEEGAVETAARAREPSVAPASKRKEIGGFSILARAIVAWFKGLFGR